MIRGLLDDVESKMLREAVESDTGLQISSYGRDDGKLTMYSSDIYLYLLLSNCIYLYLPISTVI